MSEPLRETLSLAEPLPRPTEPPITNPDGQTLATQHGSGNVRSAGPQTRLHSEPAAVPVESPELPTVPGYVIEGELGRGGMGVVYKARHTHLKRLVALKMILGDSTGKETLRRFRAEEVALAQMAHPNIVQVYEVGEPQAQPYFALEFVDGGSLDRWLHSPPQPPRQSAALVRVLALAMQTAHEKHIIHRDLKPA